ncbi:hypothetical protein D8Y20_12510 [Mariprofundus sp. EBB-1]|uniref:hypothetical protein n=1 Tax=Mariprofundus sp. EBB-1 TaxID=2650971 RepID=UPI000EF1E756|nr:hypothetical protein [Mariprofundus sp. EBB-1]RLL49808.1 hypothetical protein D8Y20_12510 [Mariprofundus sp. EBB-1]
MEVEILTCWTGLIVAILGALAGLAEIISRYKDAPLSAVLTLSGMTYLLINGLSAVIALYLVEINAWQFGVDQNSGHAKTLATQVIVAGLGSIIIFRSSLFNVQVGDKTVGIGPSAILQVILFTLDRDLDRTRAQHRADTVKEIMTDIDFSEAIIELPPFCFALMQNVTEEEQADFKRGQELLLKNTKLSNQVRLLNLGLMLLEIVGEAVLRKAVITLDEVIHK